MQKIRNNENQDSVKEMAELYYNIARTAIDGFWITDLDGHFLDVNDAYCRLIGYSRTELLKMKISDVEANESPVETARHIGKIKRNGEDRFITRHRRRDRKIIDLEVSAKYIRDMGGLISAFLRDISKRRRIDNAMIKDQAETRKETENQLSEAYGLMGTVNRKISVLLELAKQQKNKGDKQKITDHVLNLAVGLSGATTGFLYSSKMKGQYNLLSSLGVGKDRVENVSIVSTKSLQLLRHLLKEKAQVTGDIKQHKADLLRLNEKNNYFVTLPLSKGKGLDGFIFLGFDEKKSLDQQDQDFLDVFAIHASTALVRSGVLK